MLVVLVNNSNDSSYHEYIDIYIQLTYKKVNLAVGGSLKGDSIYQYFSIKSLIRLNIGS